MQVVCNVAWRDSKKRHARRWDLGADLLPQQVEFLLQQVKLLPQQALRLPRQMAHLQARPPFDPHLLQKAENFWAKPSSVLHKK